MEKYGPDVSLKRFRRDFLHRNAMCDALDEDEPRYAPVTAGAQRSLTVIDAKRAEVERAEDLLVKARATERARKVKAVASYDQARRDLAAEALALVSTLLPKAPSALRRQGIARARALLEEALTKLNLPETPESVRAEHVPALTAEIARLKQADEAEDRVRASLAALRASLAVFKAEREIERVRQYASIADISASRAVADEFFLTAYEAKEAGGDAATGPSPPAAPAAGA